MTEGPTGRTGPGLGNTSSTVSGRARDLVQARDISGGVHFHTVQAAEPRRGPRQLPAASPAFTGRRGEFARLLALVEEARTRNSPGTVLISAIDGMAGIGKTALAVHAGHRLAEHYPDGQLFVELRGNAQGMPPREPAEALAAILHAYGTAPAQIPPELEGRAAAYRDLLAETRTLIVLDDAAAEAQVRPLIPGAEGCLVIITSRRRLKALDDARMLSLDVLPPSDSSSLFCDVADLARAEQDERLLAEIAALCGHLPLALRIAAALIRNRRGWDLRRLASRLREDGRHDLSGFADTDRSLAAVFDLSYGNLEDAPRRLYRRLGLIPGPDTDVYAAAALLDADLAGAEQLLDNLVDHNLLTESTERRFRTHDLVRLHARTIAGRDPADERRAATDRLLDHYQRTAQRAGAFLAWSNRPEPIAPAGAEAPPIPDRTVALAWFRDERANLEAALSMPVDDKPHQVFSLAWGLACLLRVDGPWPDALAAYAAALAAAQKAGDRLGQADSLGGAAGVRRLTGDYSGATHDVHAALTQYRDLDDLRGQAKALTDLGAVQRLTGRYREATRDLQEALKLQVALGDPSGQAQTLTWLGDVRRASGDYRGAAHDQQEALKLYQALGDDGGRASALAELGMVRRATGDFAGAERDLQEALELYTHTGNRYGRASSLTRLADVWQAIGDLERAARDLQEAVEICANIGHRLGQANALTRRGDIRRETGDFASANHDLRRGLELYREIGSHGNVAWASNKYAALFAATGDLDRAQALYREALDVAHELRQPDDEAIALEGIAHCLLRTGQPERGADHLAEALNIFRRLGMHPDIERITARTGTQGEDPQGAAEPVI